MHVQAERKLEMAVEGKASGGKARAEKLSAKERSEIAKKAATARWNKDIPVAMCGATDHPLCIGDSEIPCYVLEDGRRVLAQGGMIGALGMSYGGSYSRGGDRLAKFVNSGRLKPFIGSDLRDRTEKPIRFRTPQGNLANGYEATILADICDAVLAARADGKLQKQQEHIAMQCEILVRAFARVGIIALVDEATGYQEVRSRNALARILEAFIAKELQAWIQTFPSDFYQEMFRLRGLDYPNDSVRRPQYFGHLTNDIVYKRLAPGVLEELKRVTPRNEKGRRTHRYFQRLTSNLGYPKLREHLGAVVAIMRLSDNWNEFMYHLDRFHPRQGETMMLPFGVDEEDDGTGL